MRFSHSVTAILGACPIVTTACPRCAASPDDQAVLDPAHFEVEGTPEEAHVHGKYRTLLRRIHCPEDLPSYGRFNDYGIFTGTAWHNYKARPPGYWVYVYPDWYIWQDSTAAGPKVPGI